MVMIKEFVRLRFIEDGKPISELSFGDDLWRRKNKWMNKSRVIDKKNTRYRETITDPQTGEVVFLCDEPLDEHQGHGSAKKRP
jgi:hypothetical protein